MKLCQIREYSKNSLKGKRAKSFFISMCIPTILLLFRLLELCMASVTLYISELTPKELFYGSFLWLVFAISCTFLKCISISAIKPFVTHFFSDIVNTSISDNSVSEIISDTNTFRRSFCSMFMMKIISFFFLIPLAFFTLVFIKLCVNGYEKNNSDVIFLTVHAFMLIILSILLWIWAILGIMALPFLIIKFPKTKITKLIGMSFRVMKNSRKGAIKIILFYILKLVIPFAFIFALPEFNSAISLYINICIKEKEYENCIYSRNRTANDTSKFSAWKKRHIKTSPDKA